MVAMLASDTATPTDAPSTPIDIPEEALPSSMTWSAFAEWAVGPPLRILLIIAFAVALRWLVHRAISSVERRAEEQIDEHQDEKRGLRRVFDAATGLQNERRRQRTATLGSLLRSVSTFVIGIIAGLTIMAELGLPLGPLLASAGVGGVALGFGAQSLVKDFLSGVFMVIEDQYGVGDVIDTGEAIGTVEEVGLRITRLRDATGVVWFIRNGEIIRIGNRSQGWSMASIDIPVHNAEDPVRVMEVLEEVSAQIAGDPEFADVLIEPPSVAGVESVAGGVMTLRVFAKCRPNEQWGLQREFRERAKVALDAAGIQGPSVPPFTPPQ